MKYPNSGLGAFLDITELLEMGDWEFFSTVYMYLFRNFVLRCLFVVVFLNSSYLTACYYKNWILRI